MLECSIKVDSEFRLVVWLNFISLLICCLIFLLTIVIGVLQSLRICVEFSISFNIFCLMHPLPLNFGFLFLCWLTFITENKKKQTSLHAELLSLIFFKTQSHYFQGLASISDISRSIVWVVLKLHYSTHLRKTYLNFEFLKCK